jgi:hypothetical protein
MRRVSLIVAGVAIVMLSLGAARPANAGYGAVAYDEYAGKSGVSWNQPTQARAEELALKQCASEKCQVHPVAPNQCGALAKSDKDKAWGGAERATKEDAEHDAIERCQTHTEVGKCKVLTSDCNK